MNQSDEPNFLGQTPALFNLVYCSRAVDGMDKSAVDQIIATAHRNNPRYGITGMLVFGSHVFFQWLEGPRDHIEQLMANLKKDPRHAQVVILSENEDSDERMFPDWAMELVSAEHIQDVLEDALGQANNPRDADALRGMLKEVQLRLD